MGAVDELIAALDAGNFDTVLDKAMDGKDKAGLEQLMNDMTAKVAGIPDQEKRHLFKNGIASLKMMADTM
ncbi:MAG: hypothetical protein V3S29_05715 [bacterium]